MSNYIKALIILALVVTALPGQAVALYQQEEVDSLALMAHLGLKDQMQFDPEYKRVMNLAKADRNDTGILNELGMILVTYDHLDSAETVFRTVLSLQDGSAKARNGLGQVYFRKGRSAVILFETMKRILGKDNYSKAVKEFQSALDIEPDYHTARFNMAMTYIARAGDDDLRTAVSTVQDLISRSPEFPSAHYLLGRAYFDQENFSEAEKTLQKQVEIDPSNGPGNIYLANTCYRLEKINKFSDLYMTGLENLTDQFILEDIFTHVSLLMTRDESKEYSRLPVDKRGQFIADFWKKQDPNILSRENERLIEHMERLDHVAAMYNENNFRGYDDRGMIYIKYGKPDAKKVDFGNADNIADNESWLYSRINKNLGFDFVNIGSTYRLVPDLSYATHPPSVNAARRLYNDRIELGGIYTEIGGRASVPSEGFLTDMALFGIRKDEALAKAPVQKHNVRISAIPINFPLSLTQFRGSNGKTSVEVYYGIPLSQLEYREVDTGYTGDVVTHLVIMDSNKVRLDEVHRTKTLNMRSMEDMTGRFSLGGEYIALDPGEYMIGFEIKQDDPPRLGLYQFSVPIKDFRSDDLMISELRASSESPGLEIRDVTSRTQVGLQPYPFRSLNRQQPLVLYFEVYNLSLGGGDQTSYKVEYTIKSDSGSSNIFKKIGSLFSRGNNKQVSVMQERSGTERTAHEMISLDIAEIPASEAVITVSVTDLLSGKKVTALRRVQVVN